MKRAFLTTIAVCLAMPANAQEEAELRLAPSSVWAVNYADETCELARTFGAGEQEVTLLFRTAEPGGRFFLSAYGQPLDMEAPTANVFTEFGNVEQLTPLFFAVKNA